MATTKSSNTVVNIKQVPIAFAQANTAFASANNVAPQIQPAFSTANSAGLYANASFLHANNAYVRANNSLNANVGGTVTGNVVVIGNVVSDAFQTSGPAGDITGANAIFANYIFASNTNLHLLANSSYAQANAAFNAANNASDSWVRNQANLAFDKANTSLSNTNLNVFGTLRMLNQSGDEGGELFLDKPVSNTSLAAGVTVDIFQNKLRIFETGGSIRGAFIDIANTTANGVGSEIVKYDANNSSTGFLSLPNGTTAQRPASTANGVMRYNTSNNVVEVYMPTAGWTIIASDSLIVDYLIVGGGGAGGSGHAGGGGAGGYISGSSLTVYKGTSYPAVVGAGGTGATYNSSAPSVGSNTSIFGYTAIRGGYGGGQNQPGIAKDGTSGGSGGGGGNTTSGAGDGGAGTPGQGFPGGIGSGGNSWSGAGGGGASAAGSNNPNSSTGGAGGAGIEWINSVAYAGGGGGGGGSPADDTGGAGGFGGGGPGVAGGSRTATSGTTNRGGGGGGSRDGPAGNGGSGVIIVRYPGTTERASGGTITTSGGYTYHTFTGSGTFLPT